jgi:two-component system response regulator FlrC
MRILIIGPAGGHIMTAAEIISKRGIRVLQCNNQVDALQSLREGKGVELVLIEVHQDISAFVQQLKKERITTIVVAYGVEAETELAVKAIKAGAKEYLPLPPDEAMVLQVLETLTHESSALIAQSPAMQRILKIVEQVAAAEASVLITGESGTGKEVIARLLHAKSRRSARDFVAVNCAAIPEQLLESELFGHEKGAFTGAVARRIGKFEEAQNSTLLLDEISEMDLRLQAKLLRVIQERELVRVGGNQAVALDIRFIATSNRALRQYVQEGKFREDLYFRLQVIHIHLPPLRERPEDIKLLAQWFMEKYAKLNGMEEKNVSESAYRKMLQYNWPGNVRELENTMHRALLLASGDNITAEDILLLEDGAAVINSTDNHQTSDDISRPWVGKTMESVEKALIIDTLTHCDGNRTQAATLLGISIRTLRNKLALYRLEEGVA